MTNLTVNGESRALERAMTVADFLELHNLHARRVVVEHNGTILPRDSYPETLLEEGDTLEIVQAMAGG
jgi:sulfur carrier protein